MQTLQFTEEAQKNLDFILSLANVSKRGKEMLLRDIIKMEEASVGETKDEELTDRSNEGGSAIDSATFKNDMAFR